MQRKIATLPPLTCLVAEEAGAAFVIDVRQGRLMAANDVAAGPWAAGAPIRFPISLDRAMPALSTLQALFDPSRSRRNPKRPKIATLTFWTLRGVWSIEAAVRPLEPVGYPGHVLIVAAKARSEPKALATAPAATLAQASKPQAPLPAAMDLATLARIRAAIELGSSDRPVLSAEPEALFEAARSRAASESGALRQPAPDDQASALARVAHEVRTPLAAIAALADVMRQEHFGPIKNARYKEYIGDIHDSACHALAVVSGMLDPSALSMGRPQLTPERLQLNPIVASSLSSMKPLAVASGLRLVGKLAPRLPAVVLDAGSLRQMLLNLIANAIQYAGTGATVTVATSRRKDGLISLEVRDNGRGMAAAKIARVLGPPEKAVPAQGDRRGLGLPFTRLLAEANGAALTLTARRGRGTRAAIVIPTASGPTARAPARPRRESRPKSSRRS